VLTEHSLVAGKYGRRRINKRAIKVEDERIACVFTRPYGANPLQN
jgi:hypothetical protein